MLDVCFGGDRRKRKTDSTLKVKKVPSQREAGISHVLELFYFENRDKNNFERCMLSSMTSQQRSYLVPITIKAFRLVRAAGFRGTSTFLCSGPALKNRQDPCV